MQDSQDSHNLKPYENKTSKWISDITKVWGFSRNSILREAINIEKKKDFLWNNFVKGGGVWLISYLYFIFPNTLQTHFKHPATPFKHP